MGQRAVAEQLRLLMPRFAAATPSIENLVFAYTAAAVLRTDEDEWQLFCMAPEWKKRRKRPSLSDDRDDALMHVMRFLLGTGPKVSLPVKQAMKLLRPHWMQNLTPFNLHESLMREVQSEKATVAVRFIDGDVSRLLLALPRGTEATVRIVVLPSKGRANHVFEIMGVQPEPL